MKFSVGLYLFSCISLTSLCSTEMISAHYLNYNVHTNKGITAAQWETCLCKKAIPRRDGSSAPPANQQLARRWTGSSLGNSQPLAAEQDQSNLHFIVIHEFPGIASPGQIWKWVGWISPRLSLSGCGLRDFHAQVTGTKLSHGEGIVHFSLWEGGILRWLLPETSNHGQGPENGQTFMSMNKRRANCPAIMLQILSE